MIFHAYMHIILVIWPSGGSNTLSKEENIRAIVITLLIFVFAALTSFNKKDK